MNEPLHPSINPEILVKIVPLGSESRGLESRPLTIKVDHLALPASLPSGG